MINKYRVACVIPTFNGASMLSRLFRNLRGQSRRCEILVVDSSSRDDSRYIAEQYADDVKVIEPYEFNHGATRQMMVESYPGYDIYVFLTQDAYPENEQAIERIITPFDDPRVGAVCGRQLPHLNANPYAAHARLFNYPPESRVVSIEDVANLGIKAAFMSNSFAAYRREALMDVGGFPRHVILSEDMYVAAKMILAGWKVAYAADACCRHSHNYSSFAEFRRYFDIGVFHAREPWIRATFGGAGGEGLRYVVSELRFLGRKNWHLWGISLWRNALKLIGYKLGQAERFLPCKLKRRLSMHARYWDDACVGS